jgi:hypothetical protein
MTSPEHASQHQVARFDWLDVSAWQQASRHTLHCLIGCNIGDFEMLIYLQAYHTRSRRCGFAWCLP